MKKILLLLTLISTSSLSQEIILNCQHKGEVSFPNKTTITTGDEFQVYFDEEKKSIHFSESVACENFKSDGKFSQTLTIDNKKIVYRCDVRKIVNSDVSEMAYVMQIKRVTGKVETSARLTHREGNTFTKTEGSCKKSSNQF
jgi:hypothetical protein